MFSTPAYAQAAGAAAPAGPEVIMMQLLPLVMILVVFYFLLIRPIRRGDSVITSGGIIGKVTKVAEDELTVEIAPNVAVRVVKSTVSQVQGKSEPVVANDAKS